MKILLAEDEKSLSKALKAILTKSNYSVDCVFDGEEAVLYAMASEYDLVIMDIMMPKQDGISALKEIRAKGNNVPVLMLTAKSEISRQRSSWQESESLQGSPPSQVIISLDSAICLSTGEPLN